MAGKLTKEQKTMLRKENKMMTDEEVEKAPWLSS